MTCPVLPARSVRSRLAGALAPSLVFQGAMKRALTPTQFSQLLATDPRAVEELMWI